MPVPAQNNWRTPALTTALVALASVGVYVVTEKTLSPPAPKTITLRWQRSHNEPGLTTEVWASTNLTTWTLRTNVIGTNVTLPCDKAREFFKIRNRLGSHVSDWARVTP